MKYLFNQTIVDSESGKYMKLEVFSDTPEYIEDTEDRIDKELGIETEHEQVEEGMLIHFHCRTMQQYVDVVESISEVINVIKVRNSPNAPFGNLGVLRGFRTFVV